VYYGERKDGALRGLSKKSGIAGRDKVLVFIKNTQKEEAK
jgi:hypothetical protein